MNLESLKKLTEAGATIKEIRTAIAEAPDPYWKQLGDMRLALIKSINDGFGSSFELTPPIQGMTHIWRDGNKLWYTTENDLRGPLSELSVDQLVWIEQRLN